MPTQPFTPSQRQRLIDALLDAFASRDELDRLVWAALQANPQTVIAEGRTLTAAIENVVDQAAAQTSGVRRLVEEAANLRMDDVEVAAIAADWAPLDFAPASPTQQWLNAYLEEAVRDANILPWSLVNRNYADPDKGEALELADIYTELDTSELRKVEREEDLRHFMAHIHEAKRLPAQEAANQSPRLLILGDPGSGKSTFTKHLAYTLAQASLAADPQPWLAVLKGWQHGNLLPLRIELRQVAAFAAHQKRRQQGDASLILSYLETQLLPEWGVAEAWPQLSQRLRSRSQPVLLLLDGLDEAPSEQRQLIVDAVNQLAQRYPHHRYLVTCRPYAYIGQSRRLQRFKEVTLAPFSREQIDHFVANWYRRLSEHHRLSATESRRRQESLQQALRRRDLQGLAERPLLLTVMTTLHSFTGKLPEDRAELYQDAVDLLLQRWETRIGGERSLLETLNLPGLKLSDLLAGLYEVAFRAHQQQTAGPSNEDASIDSASAESADIDEARLRQWLAPYLGDSFDKAELFVRYIWERAGLLYRHKSNAFTFLHRSFQEYLAACHLTYQDDYPGEAASLVQADYERWREVFVLAAGHAARTQRLSQAIASVNALCPAAVEECEEPATAPPWRLAHLAGQALLEIGLLGVQRRPEGKALLKRTQQWLATAIGQEAVLPASERVQIGRSLGRLGDPRTPLSDPRQIEFIHIPAGAFTLGSSGQAPEYYDEPPAYRHSLAYDYWMARYPITQAHYAAFVADGGYRQAGFWGEAVQDGFWRAGEVRRRYWNNKRNEVVDEWMQAPADYGEPYSLPNHPLVGVNWYEALAFTRWLTEQLAAAGKLPAGTGVQLPSEAEWEKAARGATTWAYPYGEQTDPNRSNYRGTGIGATSAPGCFPGGRSPYGVEELSGNVWEWTRSLWGSEIEKPDFGYPYDASDGRENLAAGASAFRVLRGGSYFDSAAGVRCALRGGNYPDNWDDNIGFRVALSPSPSDL